jgi:hypothetical protein
MAKLPNADHAVVPDKKLSGYLLSPTHPEGAPKAKFFASFGFRSDDPDTLRNALLAHAQVGQVIATTSTSYGTLYEVAGRVNTPDGHDPWVLVVWMIEIGTDWPRLITAVPSEDKT